MEYIAYLHKDKDSDYGVSFPDFPGVVTAGKTLEEARRLAEEALLFHIEGMKEDKLPLPGSSTLDQVAPDPSAIAFMVPISIGTVRINVTARENQVAKIDRLADLAGMTRSAFMVQASLRSSRPERRAHKPNFIHRKKRS